MNEVLAIWFLTLVMIIIYTHFLYEGTTIEKVKFIGVFMGVFTLACVGVMRM